MHRTRLAVPWQLAGKARPAQRLGSTEGPSKLVGTDKGAGAGWGVAQAQRKRSARAETGNRGDAAGRGAFAVAGEGKAWRAFRGVALGARAARGRGAALVSEGSLAGGRGPANLGGADRQPPCGATNVSALGPGRRLGGLSTRRGAPQAAVSRFRAAAAAKPAAA